VYEVILEIACKTKKKKMLTTLPKGSEKLLNQFSLNYRIKCNCKLPPSLFTQNKNGFLAYKYLCFVVRRLTYLSERVLQEEGKVKW